MKVRHSFELILLHFVDLYSNIIETPELSDLGKCTASWQKLKIIFIPVHISYIIYKSFNILNDNYK